MPVRKGDKVRALVHHNGVKSGTEGKVIGVYSGTYFAVSYPGISGPCYSPATHCEPQTGSGASPQPSAAPGGTGAPSLPAGGGTGGGPATASASTWERLMSALTGR